MKKILLLDNRDTRQKDLCKFNLNKYESILDNVISDEACERLLDAFLNDHSYFDSYDVILMHENIYENKNNEVSQSIKKYCKDKSNYLVLFSGGITKYYNDDILGLESTEFYNKNLELFLDDTLEFDEINILILGYGYKWKLTILLNVLEKINCFINNEKYIDYEEFEIDNINICSLLLPMLNKQDAFYEKLEMEINTIADEEDVIIIESLGCIKNELETIIKMMVEA